MTWAERLRAAMERHKQEQRARDTEESTRRQVAVWQRELRDRGEAYDA